MLADVFKNFRNKCIEIYELDPARFLSITGLELELLIYIDMLLMAEKGNRDGISQAINGYAEANNRYMKNYDKNTTLLYLMYLDANNLYRWAMSETFFVDGFEWVEPLSQFKEDFIKTYDENRNFLGVDVECPKYLHNLHSDIPFLPERKKI